MNTLNQWQGISEFVSVVEAGSFTAASRRLGISTAQVSRQVNALEQRLGLALLHRTTRKVRVSEAGNRYYQQCRQLLDGFNEAEQNLQQLQQTPQGKLRLTAPITYGERTLMPLLNDFLKQHPKLEIEVQLTNAQLDIVDGGFDLAIRLGQLPQNSRLRARALSQRQSYTCAAPSYIAAHGQPHTLSELKHHNCLLGSLSQWRFIQSPNQHPNQSQNQQQEQEPQLRTLNVSGNLRANSGLSLVDAALKGIGLVQLPGDYVEEYLARGELVEVLNQHRPPPEGIWGIYPASRWSSLRLTLLLDFLQENLKKEL